MFKQAVLLQNPKLQLRYCLLETAQEKAGAVTQALTQRLYPPHREYRTVAENTSKQSYTYTKTLACLLFTFCTSYAFSTYVWIIFVAFTSPYTTEQCTMSCIKLLVS